MTTPLPHFNLPRLIATRHHDSVLWVSCADTRVTYRVDLDPGYLDRHAISVEDTSYGYAPGHGEVVEVRVDRLTCERGYDADDPNQWEPLAWTPLWGPAALAVIARVCS